MSDLNLQWFQRLIDVTYMKIGWFLVELLMFGVDGIFGWGVASPEALPHQNE
jgi:hypothetical protein